MYLPFNHFYKNHRHLVTLVALSQYETVNDLHELAVYFKSSSMESITVVQLADKEMPRNRRRAHQHVSSSKELQVQLVLALYHNQ